MIDPMKRIVESTIGANDAGAALADWLVSRFSYAGRDRWVAFISDGSITVNGRAAPPDLALSQGDLIAFRPRPEDCAEPEVDKRIRTLYEDDDFLVVYKPPNLPCHPGGRFFENTLWAILAEAIPTVRIATRLDRETSGCVLICLTAEAARRIQKQGESGSMAKEYDVLVHGDFPKELDAEGFIGADGSSAVRKKRLFVMAAPGGEPPGKGFERCGTFFRRTGSFRKEEASSPISAVRAVLRTGRTHQIRATLRSLGYPVVGDKLYGTDETRFVRFAEGTLTEEDQAALVLDNQALHCAEISFLSRKGSPVLVRCDPPWKT